MKMLQKYSLIAMLFCTMLSCTAPLDVTTKAGEEHLVIYGHITNDRFEQSIKITRSAGFFSTDPPQGISGAVVTVTLNGELQYTLEEDPTEAGKYVNNTLPAIEGAEYTLNIGLDFDGDGEREQYTATSYMPYAARVDSITLQPSESFAKMVELLLFGRMSDDEKGGNYFTIQLYKNNWNLNDSLSRFATLDGKYIIAKEIRSMPVYLLDQEDDPEKLFAGDTLSLRVNNITEEYYTFIDNAQREVGGSVPIFSGPPANVPTNIKQSGASAVPIVGFFTAYSGHSVSLIVDKDYAR